MAECVGDRLYVVLNPKGIVVAFFVRVSFDTIGSTAARRPLTPTLSPQGGARGRRECALSTGRLDARASPCDNSGMDSSPWNYRSSKAVGFVHLHVHSAYSLREGALTIWTRAKLAKADAMPAMAIGDTNNLFGALEFSEKLAKTGVQPIIGAQMTVDFADAAPAFCAASRGTMRARRSFFWRRTRQATGHLMRLASALWLAPEMATTRICPLPRWKARKASSR